MRNQRQLLKVIKALHTRVRTLKADNKRLRQSIGLAAIQQIEARAAHKQGAPCKTTPGEITTDFPFQF